MLLLLLLLLVVRIIRKTDVSFAENNGGQISDSEMAAFVFSENPYEEDTNRSFAFVIHS